MNGNVVTAERSALRSLLLAITLALAGCSGGGSNPPPPLAAPAFFTVAASPAVYYADYTGPKRPALLAVNAGGRFVTASQAIVLDGQMAGPILDGNVNFYVWGIGRGGATNAPFPHEPNVAFDAVVLVKADPAAGTVSATVNLLGGAPPQPVATALLLPDTLEVTIPVSLLPSTGVTPERFVWNLWPRSAVGGTAAAQIASFIPQNAMASLLAR